MEVNGQLHAQADLPPTKSLEQEMDKLRKDWKIIKTDARNRVRWKKVVEALCSSENEED
jgi:hypothetical protein